MTKPIQPNEAMSIKTCCAALYESDWAKLLLGDSFHPGGLALTARLGTLLKLDAHSRVLDVASGKGASAIFLAQQFSCQVVGVDFGAQSIVDANRAATHAGIAERVQFFQGDAESLKFDGEEFDAVICECAFCTFPNKPKAAMEFARVLRPGGRIGLSDLTRVGDLPQELETLLAWIACVADAQPLAEYVAYLQSGGFAQIQTELHDDALAEMVNTIRAKLLGAELLVRLKQLDLPGADFEQAKALARSAAETIRAGKLGYAILVGIKP
ncbi:MAG: methyltransferase domain-containing protein, partial [Anaerolineales bacterium]|nr:methyltransferase domain-containing protein [Anaerolineales bacterium]